MRNLVMRSRPIGCSAGGTFLYLYPVGQIAEVLWAGNFEVRERDFVARYLRRGMCIVNVGANVGLYTVMAAALVGEEGEVHAFEPSTETFQRLLANLKLNHCSRVIAQRSALSDRKEIVVLRADPKYPMYDGHRYIAKVDAQKEIKETDEIVDCQTFDVYWKEYGRQHLDLMIIDVEGAEYAVLRGAMQALKAAYKGKK